MWACRHCSLTFADIAAAQRHKVEQPTHLPVRQEYLVVKEKKK